LQSTTTFDNIRDLIPRNRDGTLDKGIIPKWTYVLNKRKIAKHRKRLTEIRQMFVFIKQAMSESQPLSTQTGGGGSRDPPKLEPVTLSGPGRDAAGNPVHFSATLIMQPIQTSQFTEVIERSETRGPQVKPQKPPGYLRSLRQNPFFAADLLIPQRVPETRAGFSSHGSSRDDRRDEAVERIMMKDMEERKRMEVEQRKYRPERMSRTYEDDEVDEAVFIPDDIEATEEVEDLVHSVSIPLRLHEMVLT
jgi:hypothetical protein